MTSRSTSLLRPPALRPGDRVAVLSISSPADQGAMPAGLDALRFAGLEPVVYPSALDTGSLRPYLAGDDELRVGDLTAALLDPDIAGIVFACGGSGAQRTMAAMDWSVLQGVAPKVLAGYSDVTAVLEAVAVKLGWASLFSPMVVNTEHTGHYSFGSLVRCLMAPERATHLEFPDAVTVVAGRAEGVTVGGNLCLLTTSLGTDTSRPAAGGILLIEDESEDDYRIDRMLTHLLRAGFLDGVAGIVTGAFYNCGPVEQISPILTERLSGLGVPMISWANVGHGGHFQTFPLGVAAVLDADACTVHFLEPPLVPGSPVG